jgi:hypothetical protein
MTPFTKNRAVALLRAQTVAPDGTIRVSVTFREHLIALILDSSCPEPPEERESFLKWLFSSR